MPSDLLHNDADYRPKKDSEFLSSKKTKAVDLACDLEIMAKG